MALTEPEGAASAISSLQDRAARIREREVAKALRRLRSLSPQQQEIVASMAKSIVDKLLDPPITYLKTRDGNSQDAQLARELFQLDGEGEGVAHG